jgi:hypothetical protein
MLLKLKKQLSLKNILEGIKAGAAAGWICCVKKLREIDLIQTDEYIIQDWLKCSLSPITIFYK